jgi:hypothetical protein
MDWNRFEGNWKQFSGTVKEKWGKLTRPREQGPLGHARLVKMCPLRRISLSRFWLEALQGAGSMSTLVAPIKALRPSAKTALKPISATETGRWRAIVAGFCSFHLLLA